MRAAQQTVFCRLNADADATPSCRSFNSHNLGGKYETIVVTQIDSAFHVLKYLLYVLL